jgi:hypothetical protein
MVTWEELETGDTVSHVEDYENGIAYMHYRESGETIRQFERRSTSGPLAFSQAQACSPSKLCLLPQHL